MAIFRLPPSEGRLPIAGDAGAHGLVGKRHARHRAAEERAQRVHAVCPIGEHRRHFDGVIHGEKRVLFFVRFRHAGTRGQPVADAGASNAKQAAF